MQLWLPVVVVASITACLLLSPRSKPLASVPAPAVPAYVISVPNTRDRALIKSRFEGKVDGVQIFDGVDGTKVAPAGPLKPGELGCAYSHMRLWERVLHTGVPAALVFEDDAVPVDDFRNRLTSIMQLVDDTVDMVYLGHCHENSAATPYAAGLKNSLHPRCTHGYLVTRKGAEKLVAWAATAKLRAPIDELLARKIFSGSLRALTCDPPIVTTTDDESVITKMGGRGVAAPRVES